MNTEPETLIRRFVRDTTGQPIGIIVGQKGLNRKWTIGWSKAATKRGDRFDKEMGLRIAVGRANAADAKNIPYVCNDREFKIPHDIKKMLPDFKDRCERFFK